MKVTIDPRMSPFVACLSLERGLFGTSHLAEHERQVQLRCTEEIVWRN